MTTKAPSKKHTPAPAPVKETYGIWAVHDVGKTWDNLMEAVDVAEEAATRNRCKELIFKLVKTVDFER